MVSGAAPDQAARRDDLRAHRLLEREPQLELIAGWLAEVCEGKGRLALVSGGAGLGKTALLGQAARLAEADGLRVLSARGRELEREMAFGVARQLFEADLRRVTPAERQELLVGAARHAQALLGLPSESEGGGDLLGVIHALYWLAVNLAERQSLLLVVDDLHWADSQTLRWLNYLVPRIADVGLVVLARRASRGARNGGTVRHGGEQRVRLGGRARIVGNRRGGRARA